MSVAWFPAWACADIMDFGEWTLVEDPPHPNFTSSVDSSSQITLSATTGPIPSGTDIGYQTVNGTDVANSTSGWAFDPAFDFSVAADFNLAFGSPTGGFSLGMGIGEDRDGTDSAGAILLRQNSGVLTFSGAARANDIPQSPVTILVAGQTTGRFLVSCDAASGDVMLGVSTDGDNTPEGTGTFSGIQNSWGDEALLVSLFARGDNGVDNWSSGTADALFTNFHVTSGTPSAVPEPSSFVMTSLALVGLVGYGFRRRRCSRVALRISAGNSHPLKPDAPAKDCAR
jgi:hypothetical protein